MGKRNGKIGSFGEQPMSNADRYKADVARGFDVENMRAYRHNGKDYLEVNSITPYKCDDKPVYGFTVVDMKSDIYLDEGERRNYNTCELWINDNGTRRNLEDVYPDCNFEISQKDFDGNFVNIDAATARNEIGKFASNASHMSHVMVYEEYKALMSDNNKKLVDKGFVVDKPTEKQYETYLNVQKRMMMDSSVQRIMPYVGKYKTPESVDKDLLPFTKTFEENMRELPDDVFHDNNISYDDELGE